MSTGQAELPLPSRRIISSTRHSPGSVTTTRSGRCRATARSSSPVKLPVLPRSSSFDIVDDEPCLPQLLGEMAHGGEDEGDLLLVVAHIGRLVGDLAHQHDVLRRIGVRRGSTSPAKAGRRE